ncbi:unnamed protein product [Paramecium pentaurelia]|uniref:Uncharacterized protein n=1 Tax=Paramecium pentaurelia TaxID=43138 RepID=A0A8S1UFY4_9CILI|nr:unnamed protein product [Paramecium pentaurelia]
MFDLQPQSSSLSPNSKTRFYQEKLDKAHEIIDFLEVLLYERRIHQTSYKNVEIPTLQLNKKFIDIIDKKSSSYVTTPLQYSTPRDRRTILSLGDQTSARFVEEIKSRHVELILQQKDEGRTKEQRVK